MKNSLSMQKRKKIMRVIKLLLWAMTLDVFNSQRFAASILASSGPESKSDSWIYEDMYFDMYHTMFI